MSNTLYNPRVSVAITLFAAVLLAACDGSGTQILGEVGGNATQVGDPVGVAVDSDVTTEQTAEVPAPTEPVSAETFLADRLAIGPITIMPVGDSITQGIPGVSSYRLPFTESLESAGCAITMVGSQQTSREGGDSAECVDSDGDGWGWDGTDSCFADAEPESNVYVAPHEGYSSHRAEHFLYGHSSGSGDNPGIGVSMANFQPDVVLLHIGSVDMFADQTVDSTLLEIETLIDAIYEVKPETLVLIANVIPWFSDRPYPQIGNRVRLLGDAIEVMVGQRSDPMLRLVDVRSGFTESMMLADMVHPNATGEKHIANAFGGEYMALANCAGN